MKKMIKMIAAAATMAGLLAMGMMLITSSISRADGEGLPYLFPLHPACSGALRDGFVRMPWPILAKDPFTLKNSRKGKKL